MTLTYYKLPHKLVQEYRTKNEGRMLPYKLEERLLYHTSYNIA